ncbi:MAG: hypothetical protein V1809_04120 [Planctomycetota bacterium]
MEFVRKNLTWLVLAVAAVGCLLFYYFSTAETQARNRNALQDLKGEEVRFKKWTQNTKEVPSVGRIESRRQRLSTIEGARQECRGFFEERQRDLERYFENAGGRDVRNSPPDFKARYNDERQNLVGRLAEGLSGKPSRSEVEAAIRGAFKEWGDGVPNPADIPVEQKKFWILDDLARILVAGRVHAIKAMEWKVDGAAAREARDPSGAEVYKGFPFRLEVEIAEEGIPQLLTRILRSKRSFFLHRLKLEKGRLPTEEELHPPVRLVVEGFALDFALKADGKQE